MSIETDQPVTIPEVKTILIEGDGRIFTVDQRHKNINPALAERHMRTVENDSPSARVLWVIDKAIVVGCGGTGHWVAKNLALNNMAKTIHLFDSDPLEEVNRNRLDVPAGYVGHPKSVVTACEICRIRPDQNVVVYPRAFEPGDIEPLTELCYCNENVSIGPLSSSNASQAARSFLLDVPTHPAEIEEIGSITHDAQVRHHPPCMVFFDCTDSAAFQVRFYDEIVKRKAELVTLWGNSGIGFNGPLPVILYKRISYDGLAHLTITDRSTDWGLLEATDRYDVVPSWGLPAQLAANLGIYSVIEDLVEAFEAAIVNSRYFRTRSFRSAVTDPLRRLKPGIRMNVREIVLGNTEVSLDD